MHQLLDVLSVPSFLIHCFLFYLILKDMDVHLLDDNGCVLRATNIDFTRHIHMGWHLLPQMTESITLVFC